MALVEVPAGLTLRSSGRWMLRTLTTTPGPALDGRQQWVRRETRVWVGDVQVRDAWRGAGWGAYLAFLDALAGPANSFRMMVGNGRAETPVGYESATVSVAAPSGATIVTFSGLPPGGLPLGSYFSIADFLYRVAAADGLGAGQVAFNPPLRAAAPVATVARVAFPRIRVRLADDAAAQAAHQADGIGAPFTLSVIEAFER